MSHSKIEFKDLNTGHRFPPSLFKLDYERVKAYLDATESDPVIYLRKNIVPPMAIAALSMGAMMDLIVLPPGAIHVSQELKFGRPAALGEQLASHASVKRKVDRSKLQMLNIAVSVVNEQNETVLEGETGFIVPQGTEAA